ncbi:MAG: divergent polysaccharide deacetylase family protein [Armatimonadota bacterium]
MAKDADSQAKPDFSSMPYGGGSGGRKSASLPQNEGEDVKSRDSRPQLNRELTASEEPHRRGSAAAGRLAIVIDDVGNSTEILNAFLRIPAPLTFAVIPGTHYASICLQMIRASGREAVLHLPMEPLDPDLCPPGAVTVEMTDGEIEERVSGYLDALPGVVGVNNHMGSRATQDRRVMRAVLRVVGDRGLFFLDSRTAPRTVVAEVGAELGVPCLSRDGRFLDHRGSSADADEVLVELADAALSKGRAVGIGHARRSTSAAVLRSLPRLKAMGVEIVPLSNLLRKG